MKTVQHLRVHLQLFQVVSNWQRKTLLSKHLENQDSKVHGYNLLHKNPQKKRETSNLKTALYSKM